MYKCICAGSGQLALCQQHNTIMTSTTVYGVLVEKILLKPLLASKGKLRYFDPTVYRLNCGFLIQRTRSHVERVFLLLLPSPQSPSLFARILCVCAFVVQ